MGSVAGTGLKFVRSWKFGKKALPLLGDGDISSWYNMFLTAVGSMSNTKSSIVQANTVQKQIISKVGPHDDLYVILDVTAMPISVNAGETTQFTVSTKNKHHIADIPFISIRNSSAITTEASNLIVVGFYKKDDSNFVVTVMNTDSQNAHNGILIFAVKSLKFKNDFVVQDIITNTIIADENFHDLLVTPPSDSGQVINPNAEILGGDGLVNPTALKT